jgi:hypothetical protein
MHRRTIGQQVERARLSAPASPAPTGQTKRYEKGSHVGPKKSTVQVELSQFSVYADPGIWTVRNMRGLSINRTNVARADHKRLKKSVQMVQTPPTRQYKMIVDYCSIK